MSSIASVALWLVYVYRDMLQLESNVRGFSGKERALLDIEPRLPYNLLDHVLLC